MAIDDNNSIEMNGTSIDQNSTNQEYTIKIGNQHQAIIPDFIGGPWKPQENQKTTSLMLWRPIKETPQLNAYLDEAKQTYKYSEEQSLGMLYCHKNNIKRATADLQFYEPIKQQWSEADKILFEQAFRQHGKAFHRIQKTLIGKSTGDVMQYYYSWKNTEDGLKVRRQLNKKKNKVVKEQENGNAK